MLQMVDSQGNPHLHIARRMLGPFRISRSIGEAIQTNLSPTPILCHKSIVNLMAHGKTRKLVPTTK